MNYQIGQNVYCIDDEYGRIEGEVVDKSSDKVFIKWDDIKEPVEHPITSTDIHHSHKKR